jgi:hypothetical protein
MRSNELTKRGAACLIAAALVAWCGVERAAAHGAASTQAVHAARAVQDTIRSTALANGAAVAEVRREAAVTVPVTLELGAAGVQGDLGAAQFELVFPALLQFVSATPGVTGIAQTHLAAPGRIRFAFAGTAPQGRSALTLVTLSFRVAPDAPVGAEGALRLTYTARPATTGFRLLPLPAGSGSTLRVVP